MRGVWEVRGTQHSDLAPRRKFLPMLGDNCSWQIVMRSDTGQLGMRILLCENRFGVEDIYAELAINHLIESKVSLA